MSDWLAYSSLAWVEPIIAPPGDYEGETRELCDAINRVVPGSRTLLHLGCGAGINDYSFKRQFEVTGVDISEDMLAIAREINPELCYVRGDMRSVRLGRRFDAVAIPDSIGYMRTVDELRRTLMTARTHLHPGGVLLIVASTRQQFRPLNFIYAGARDELEITVFENNYLVDGGYEATLVFLIRERQALTIHSDRHRLGLFERQTWHDLFARLGFQMERETVHQWYGDNITGADEYPVTVFTCTLRDCSPPGP